MLGRSSALVLSCVTVLLASSLSPIAASATKPTAAEAMVHQINDVRRANGLRALRPSPRLSGSARHRARLMLARDVFAHFPSSTRSFSPVGEVIALRRGWRPGTAATLNDWLHSPGHRAVLLYPSVRYIGASEARGRFNGHLTTTWVVRLGTPRG